MNAADYTILIIDDDQAARDTLAALLEKSSCHIKMAKDGVEGIELAKAIIPDLILLDIMMPRMNGYEVCKLIRSDSQIKEVPIIMITALDDREAKLNGLAVGADDFLSKPFDKFELAVRLRTLRCVNRYRQLLDERENTKASLSQMSNEHSLIHSLSRKVTETQEAERRHIEAELHNDIGQMLTGLDDLGLSAALDRLIKHFAKQTGIAIRHNIHLLDEHRFDKAIETIIFRIAQEALDNIARHAGVYEANVALNLFSDQIQIRISDAGKGFDTNKKHLNTSTGLSGMRERVAIAGGCIIIDSAPNHGTVILASFYIEPLKQIYSISGC